MIKRVSATEFVRNFTDFMNRVSYLGQVLILVRGGREIAEIRPLPTGRTVADLPALLQAMPRLGSEEAESFAADVQEATARLHFDPTDPWAS